MRIRVFTGLLAAVCCILLTAVRMLPWDWGAGLTLLALAFGLPAAGKKSEPQTAALDLPRLPDGRMAFIRKWLVRIVVCASLICFWASWSLAFPPHSAAYDSISLDLNSPQELGYTRKVCSDDGLWKIHGRFSRGMVVYGNGRRLSPAADRAAVFKDSSLYYNGKVYIEVSKDIRNLTAFGKRSIFRWLSQPWWLLAVFLLICLWSSLCERGLIAARLAPSCSSGKLLTGLFVLASFCIIAYMYNELLPLKHAVDGPHYLGFTEGNTIEKALFSYRTPGYPLLLKWTAAFAPLSFNFLIVVQYGLFFLALSWLLLELHAMRLSSAACFVLFIIFSQYMFCYHNFMLADSPGLSGIILLLAMGLMLFRKISCGVSFGKLFRLNVFAALVVFLQLMIKLFPGTVFIPAGMLFLLYARRLEWKKAFQYGILFSAVCLILPLLFCSYRYMRTGDFNFASLSSFQMSSTAIILAEPSRFSELKPEIRQSVELIISETLAQNPDLKWPIQLEAPDFKSSDYEKYANRIMYHPGLRNGSWLKPLNMSQYPSLDVGLELECKKLLKELLPAINLHKFSLLQKKYLEELWSYLKYPRISRELFAENSPFGKTSRVLFLFLIPLSLAVYFARWTGDRTFFTLLYVFCAVAFLGACGTVSTFLLVTPFIEVRREMIGLFSVYFGTFGLIAASFWLLSCHIFRAALPVLQHLLNFYTVKESSHE